MERQQFWPASHSHTSGGAQWEFRTELAWMLLERLGIVAGTVRGEEDSAGRAVLDAMPVEDVVRRAFAISDLFVDTALARGELRPQTDEMINASYARAGELHRLQDKAQYPKNPWREEKEYAGPSEEPGNT